MTWNYRVVNRTYPDGTVMTGLYEVYYDDAGKPNEITTEAASIESEDGIEGFLRLLEWVKRASTEPVLDYDLDFPT